MSPDTFIDHTPFVSPKFDVNAYANAILAGETYDPEESRPIPNGQAEDAAAKTSGLPKGKGRETGVESSSSGLGMTVKGDIGVALAKLNYGIEDATKQLRQEIVQHHPEILSYLSSSTNLLSSLSSIRGSLSALDSSLNRLHSKIHQPHQELGILVERLNKAREASDLTRRASRFLVLAKRLDGQMKAVQGKGTSMNGQSARNGDEHALNLTEDEIEGERERELAKAALTLAELDVLLSIETAGVPAKDGSQNALASTSSQIPLKSLNIIQAHAPAIASARETVIQEMETMVVQGLAGLNQALLSTSLQTAYNLRLLPQLVSNLLADLNDAVEARIARVFDVASIGKEVATQEQHTSSTSSLIYRSRHKTADTAPTNQNISIWTNVLWRRLEILMDDIANCCIKVYTLEKVLRMKKDPATQVEFLEEVMKLLDEKPSFSFWTTLATGFDTQTRDACMASNFLQQTLGSGYPRLLRLFHEFFAKISVHTETVYTQDHQSPESVLVLRSISKLESLYLTRSTGRIGEAISTTFSSGNRSPPGPSEGVAVARTILNEMDAARFDPLLVKAVARGASQSLDGYVKRVEGLIVKDFSATSLIGPLASSGQITNAALVSCLYHLATTLDAAGPDFSVKAFEVLRPPILAAVQTYKRVTDAIDIAVRRELSNIVGRIHKVDFSKPVDPMSMNGSGSPYIKDLAEKLTFLRTEILGRMSLGEMGREWVMSLVRHVIRSFLLHASITRPLGESGKLKLTSDMTELEFALGSFLTTGTVQGSRNTVRLDRVGDEYKALRAFRTMLFLDQQSIADRTQTAGLPALLVLHHLIVLSPLQLPHQVHGWTEAEYVAWVDKHTEAETWKLVEKAVAGQRNGEGAAEWRGLLRSVLEQARESVGVTLS